MKVTKKDVDKLNIIIEKLNQYKNDLENIDYIHDKKHFFELMKEFRKYIASFHDKKICDMLIHSKYFPEFNKFFCSINCYYVRSLESVQALSIITKSSHENNNFIDLIDSELIKERYEMKGRIINSLDLSNAKTLIVVGSGPMPETLLYIYENTTIKTIIGLDNNHEAIYISGEMINGLHLDKIKLYQINGEDYDYKNADIIYIPIFVNNKDKILDRIVETGKKDVQILVNAGKGLLLLIYEDLYNINPRLRIEYKSSAYYEFRAQEIVKLVKYDF